VVVADRNGLAMAGRAVLTITPPAGSADPGSLAPVAANLGWRMAELYDAPVPRVPVRVPQAGHRLPGTGALGAGLHFEIRLGQVAAAVNPVQGILQLAGRDLGPALGRVRDAVSGTGGAQAGDREAAVRAAILRLQVTITDGLAASAARLGTGPGLGPCRPTPGCSRHHAPKCHLPCPEQGSSGRDRVRHITRRRYVSPTTTLTNYGSVARSARP